MDLPLRNLPDSSYQIHRTPFFRRIHRRDSDQLERLRQAYENVHNFNEKPIKAQIKKLRLGKLLSRIRQSLIRSRSIRPDNDQSHPNSAERIRAGKLAKARQLGSDYCRQNLDIPTPLLSLLESQKQNLKQEHLRVKSRLDRRLHYGNNKSQQNRMSQSNQTKIQRSHTMQKLRTSPSVHKYTVFEPVLMTEQRLRNLKMNKPKEDFIKFLGHCLATDKPNPDVMSIFEGILQSKNDLFWDLQSAINQRLEFIERHKNFMERLSNLATSTVPEQQSQTQIVVDDFLESFNSKTSIKPCSKSPEVYIRTYRYSDEDELLPPPSESLLRIPDVIDAEELHENLPAPSPLSKLRTSHLSTKLTNNLQTDPAIKMTLTQKFGDIIRDTVREESTVMLANLAKAIKH